jgi:predicted component of type VI protein secretion system
MLAELMAHECATGVASRAALAATLKEFAPAALKARLLGGGSTLFEGARAWHAYSKYYQEQGGGSGADLAAWTQRLLDRYFTESYLRESLRIRRETAGGNIDVNREGAG